MAALGFCLSLLAHGLTFWKISPLEKFPLGYLLLVILGLVLLLPLRKAWMKIEVYQTSSTAVPWAAIVVVMLILYMAFTVALASEGGNPHEINGKYYLVAHGGAREVTKQEYQEEVAYLPRILSSVLLLYYFIGITMFHRELTESMTKRPR